MEPDVWSRTVGFSFRPLTTTALRVVTRVPVPDRHYTSCPDLHLDGLESRTKKRYGKRGESMDPLGVRTKESEAESSHPHPDRVLLGGT